MHQEELNKYYGRLEEWARYYRFEPISVHADSGIDRAFKRSRFEASKFGTADAYSCVKYAEGNATGADLQEFSTKMFDMCSRHRTGVPLGFGAHLVVYPMLIVDNISVELAGFIKLYCPKHFGSAEFPSVLDFSTGYLYYYEQTPVWGYAYYAGYRRESYDLYSPKAWGEKGVSN